MADQVEEALRNRVVERLERAESKLNVVAGDLDTGLRRNDPRGDTTTYLRVAREEVRAAREALAPSGADQEEPEDQRPAAGVTEPQRETERGDDARAVTISREDINGVGGWRISTPGWDDSLWTANDGLAVDEVLQGMLDLNQEMDEIHAGPVTRNPGEAAKQEVASQVAPDPTPALRGGPPDDQPCFVCGEPLGDEGWVRPEPGRYRHSPVCPDSEADRG